LVIVATISYIKYIVAFTSEKLTYNYFYDSYIPILPLSLLFSKLLLKKKHPLFMTLVWCVP